MTLSMLKKVRDKIDTYSDEDREILLSTLVDFTSNESDYDYLNIGEVVELLRIRRAGTLS